MAFAQDYVTLTVAGQGELAPGAAAVVDGRWVFVWD